MKRCVRAKLSWGRQTIGCAYETFVKNVSFLFDFRDRLLFIDCLSVTTDISAETVANTDQAKSFASRRNVQCLDNLVECRILPAHWN